MTAEEDQERREKAQSRAIYGFLLLVFVRSMRCCLVTDCRSPCPRARV